MSWLKEGDRFVGEYAGKPISGRVIEASLFKGKRWGDYPVMCYTLEFTRSFRSDDSRLTDRLHNFEEDRQSVSNRKFTFARLADDGMIENDSQYAADVTLRIRKSEADKEATSA